MYQVSIFNNNVETVIHYPSSDVNDPHLNKIPLTEGTSVVDTISFSLYPNNPGYSNVFELVTKVKVKDVRDNSIRFTGRILDISEKMDSNGTFYKEIKCEGALSFLNDTKQRANTFLTINPLTFITQLLSIHNGKVDSYRQIQVGNIDVTGDIAHTCEFKTTLAELLAVKEKIGGEIRVREVNNIKYLDWLTSFSSYTTTISLGDNMKDMVISKDITSLGTRIIPLGANNLTIESVNGGLDYIEDVNAKYIYGVIEQTVEYKDIKDATELKNTCSSDLSKYTQPKYVLSSSALDLSYLTNIKSDQFILGARLHIVNPIMGIDDFYNVVQIDMDLLTPYNPKLTISNTRVTLTNTVNDLRKTSVQNNGVYNNVQVGSAFGIRAVRSDQKVITTINATDCITIENESKKVFSVDASGNIIVNDMTANDMKANKGTFTDIYAEGGEFNKITATGGITIEDDDASCKINALGLELSKGEYVSKMQVGVNSKGDGTAIAFDDDVEITKTMRAATVLVTDDELYVNGLWIQDYILNVIDSCNLATREWVTNNFDATVSDPGTTPTP